MRPLGYGQLQFWIVRVQQVESGKGDDFERASLIGLHGLRYSDINMYLCCVSLCT